METKTAAIEMRNITKRFGPVLANDKVWLNIYRGEILALLGENGSGKTTLMNMLSGIYFPDEGEIKIDGKEVVMQVKVGETVLYSKYAGSEFKVDGKEFTIIRQSDILAVVE